MSNREIVIELLGKLPADTPFEEIAREIELLAGIQRAREQARRRSGSISPKVATSRADISSGNRSPRLR
jgi:hypothetical protein